MLFGVHLVIKLGSACSIFQNHVKGEYLCPWYFKFLLCIYALFVLLGRNKKKILDKNKKTWA